MWVPEANHPRERYILQQTAIVRTRRWQGSAKTLVQVGDTVQASDPIVEVAGTSEIQLVDGARGLGVPPAEVRRHLQTAIGNPVAAGEVIAKKGGLFRRSLTSPVSGTLIYVDDERGIIMIRVEAATTRLNALLQGRISAIVPNESIEITTQGAIIQGMWGNGRANAGTSRLLVSAPTDSATPALINSGLRGTVLVVGASADRTLLERAQAVQVAGIIAGSMDGSLMELAHNVTYPIVLTEGFGALPINAPSFNLLGQLNGREATLLSDPQSVPEVLVARSSAPRPLYAPGALAVGDRVRLLSAPYLGQLGTIEASAGRRVPLPSRIPATVCTVQLDTGGAVQIPYANLERLVE
jgi:hypothetical protein